MTRVLAADVGGTKTAIALFETGNGGNSGAFARLKEEVFESQSFAGLLGILGEFMRGERVDAAGFGVPGPVRDGRCETTNLPWTIEAEDLRNICGTEHVALLNDAEAAILGVRAVPPENVVWLQERAADPNGVVTLVTLGTGFGRAYFVPSVGAFATESGHASFAARNAIERRLLEFLATRHENVCIEHALSGPGLKTLYEFVVSEGLTPATAQLEVDRAVDPSAHIGYLGARDLDPACAASVALFVDVLGAELGNVALQMLPRGGLYVWGGVARKLRSVIEQGDLLDSFLDKDRMRELLETLPLALLDEDNLGILGAREAALKLLRGHGG